MQAHIEGAKASGAWHEEAKAGVLRLSTLLDPTAASTIQLDVGGALGVSGEESTEEGRKEMEEAAGTFAKQATVAVRLAFTGVAAKIEEHKQEHNRVQQQLKKKAQDHRPECRGQGHPYCKCWLCSSSCGCFAPCKCQAGR